MKNINKTHLNFILLILLFLLTSCSKKVNKDYFLGDRFFYYTEDKLNIYKDLEIDKLIESGALGDHTPALLAIAGLVEEE